MLTYTVRTMTPEDLPAVAQVDLAAFSLASQRSGGHALEHPRHLMGLEYFRQAAPELCLVAETSTGEILGYNIGHRWGATAWAGPIGVDPNHMSKGAGSAMLREFCARAEADGANTIGLETSIGHNVRLYEKRGFASRSLCLRATRELTGAAAPAHFRADRGGTIGEHHIQTWGSVAAGTEHDLRLAEARQLAGMVNPGLDHGVEIAAVPASGIGQTYLAIDPKGLLVGYAVLHLRSYRSPRLDDRHPAAEPLLWILVGWPEATESLLAACEAAAVAVGGSKLCVPCYAGNPHVWSAIKACGYQPEGAFVRMMYRGEYPGTANRPWGQIPFDLSTWLG